MAWIWTSRTKGPNITATLCSGWAVKIQLHWFVIKLSNSEVLLINCHFIRRVQWVALQCSRPCACSGLTFTHRRWKGFVTFVTSLPPSLFAAPVYVTARSSSKWLYQTLLTTHCTFIISCKCWLLWMLIICVKCLLANCPSHIRLQNLATILPPNQKRMGCYASGSWYGCHFSHSFWH